MFVRDLENESTELVSLSSSGTQANALTDGACISANGRLVAFGSPATNLVPGDTNNEVGHLLSGPSHSANDARLPRLGRSGSRRIHRPLLHLRRCLAARFLQRGGQSGARRHQRRRGHLPARPEGGYHRPHQRRALGRRGERVLHLALGLGRRALRGLPERRHQPRAGRHQRLGRRLRVRPTDGCDRARQRDVYRSSNLRSRTPAGALRRRALRGLPQQRAGRGARRYQQSARHLRPRSPDGRHRARQRQPLRGPRQQRFAVPRPLRRRALRLLPERRLESRPWRSQLRHRRLPARPPARHHRAGQRRLGGRPGQRRRRTTPRSPPTAR